MNRINDVEYYFNGFVILDWDENIVILLYKVYLRFMMFYFRGFV